MSKENQSEKNKTYFLLSSLGCLMGSLALGISVFNYYKQNNIVTFDLKGTTENFLKQLQQSSLDEQSKNKTIKRFESALNSVVDEYQEDNTIVLVKPAVVSSLPDKTGEIKKKISQRMKGK